MSYLPRWRESSPLWGALLLSAGAWSLHLVVSYFLVEASCGQAAGGGTPPPGLWITLLAVTGGSVLLALVAAGYAWGSRRVLERRGPGLERSAGLAPVIVALSLFFALVILLELAPILTLACGSA